MYLFIIHYFSNVWGQLDFILIEINTFIQKGCIKLFNGDSKGIYITKESVSNKCCSFCS